MIRQLEERKAKLEKMDKITLKQMSFTACHGAYPEEKINPQIFMVTINLKFDFEKAGLSDNLEDTCDYSKAFRIVNKIMYGEPVNLIEHLAYKIARSILFDCPEIEEANVIVQKNSANMGDCFVPSVAEVTKNRFDFASEAFIGLGSNLGDKIGYLTLALNELADDQRITIEKVSKVYETAPIGGVEQDNFYNMVAKIRTFYTANELLEKLHSIEEMAARKREIHWGPRTLDLDILLFDNEEINEKNLVVPHKEMLNRAFVLKPLLEIEYGVEIPGKGKAKEFLANVMDQEIKVAPEQI